MKTAVIIIGAGPTGLMLANQLKRFGISFLVVDTKSGPTNESRALSVSARSMEVYQQLSLSDNILKESVDINGFGFYNRGKVVADFSMANSGKGISDFPKPMNAFEQSKNESILFENLNEDKPKVLWNNEFVELNETENQVEVKIKNTKDGSVQTLTANYIIGCDGARSAIRHQRNFTFEGGTYDNKFYVVDTIMTWEFGYDKVIMSPSDGVFVAFFPLKGKNRMRIIGTLPVEFTSKDDIDFDAIEKVIKNVAKFELNFESIGWHSVYRIHHRCVDKFSIKRVFLAGDAAHIHSPAGGQGMNTGLQDAHNLGWKMAMVLKQMAKPTLLNTYNEERLPFAQSLIQNTDKGFKMITSENWWIKNFRNYIILPLIGKLMKFEFLQVFEYKTLSQLFYSYKNHSLSKSLTKQNLKFKAGDRLPSVEPEFFTKFRDPVFHLVCISDDKKTENELEEIRKCFPFDIKIVLTPITETWAKLGVKNTLYILVRPDQHICILLDNINKAQITNHLEKYF